MRPSRRCGFVIRIFRSACVGRHIDVATIGALLRTSRLVTLFGTGGIGKTRCALAVAAEGLESYADGAWFVDLAPVTDPALVANAVASALGLRESTQRTMLETLVTHLRKKQVLLVVDNCEHLIASSAELVATLLERCPKLSVLATSREALRVDGEQVYNVPPLSMPAAIARIGAEEASRFEAVALFVARAKARARAFGLTDANAGDVVEICRRLDGIPLAIELAAARVAVLSPRQLVEKLDERFRILCGGDRTALPRQQTMRALIDWSYDLLGEEERRIFRALACFAGSFSPEAVVDVCGDEFDELDVLEHLGSLVEKALIVCDRPAEETRYQLLESIRAYANDKLCEAGKAAEIARRHARAYAARGERLKADYERESLDRWLHATEPELENLRLALATAFGPDGDVLVGQRIAATLDRLFMTSAPVEALRWVEKAQARIGDETPHEVAGALALAEASLCAALNRFRAALSAARRARVIFEELGDERRVADADRFAGRSLIRLGEIAAAEPMLQSVLATYRRLGVDRVGGVLRDLAVISGMRGDLREAQERFDGALAVFRASADEENAAMTAIALAEIEFQCGNAEDALLHAEQGLMTVRAMGRERVVAGFEGNIAAYLNALGRHDEAADRASSALVAARNVEATASVAFAMQHLAAAGALEPCAAVGAIERAVRVLGYLDARLTELDVLREFTEQREYEQVLSRARASIPDERVHALLQDGALWTEEMALIAVGAETAATA